MPDATGRSATEFLWTLPTRGDGRRGPHAAHPRGDWDSTTGQPDWITDLRGSDLTPFDHLSQIAVAAEHALFSGVIAPYDPQGEESWIVASALARETRWLRLIPEIALGSTTAVYAAKLSATFQRVTGGRVGWRLTPGQELTSGSSPDVAVPAEWFERAAEFLTVARGVWNERPFTYDGQWYQVENGGFPPPLADLPFPRVYTSGAQEAAVALAAAHSDVHLFALEADADVATTTAALRERSAAAGRVVTPGLVLPVIAREDEDEAWDRVERLWRANAASSTPTVAAKIGGRRHQSAVWAGFRELGFDANVGLVGSYARVAAALQHFADQGIGTFVLSGYPQIEEVYRLGEHLLHLVDSPTAPHAQPAPALAR
jgi:alkanesulfonate monooxygenase